MGGREGGMVAVGGGGGLGVGGGVVGVVVERCVCY